MLIASRVQSSLFDVGRRFRCYKISDVQLIPKQRRMLSINVDRRRWMGSGEFKFLILVMDASSCRKIALTHRKNVSYLTFLFLCAKRNNLQHTFLYAIPQIWNERCSRERSRIRERFARSYTVAIAAGKRFFAVPRLTVNDETRYSESPKERDRLRSRDSSKISAGDPRKFRARAKYLDGNFQRSHLEPPHVIMSRSNHRLS